MKEIILTALIYLAYLRKVRIDFIIIIKIEIL